MSVLGLGIKLNYAGLKDKIKNSQEKNGIQAAHIFLKFKVMGRIRLKF